MDLVKKYYKPQSRQLSTHNMLTTFLFAKSVLSTSTISSATPVPSHCDHSLLLFNHSHSFISHRSSPPSSFPSDHLPLVRRLSIPLHPPLYPLLLPLSIMRPNIPCQLVIKSTQESPFPPLIMLSITPPHPPHLLSKKKLKLICFYHGHQSSSL